MAICTLLAQVPADYFTWDNANVYFLLNDRFQNGNTANDSNFGRVADPVAGFLGGDFAGITQKINDGYFDDLGVNAIWFTAPYEQIHGAVPGYWCGNYPCAGQGHYGYHGYYTLDWTEMEPNMGTFVDFQAFVDAAHNRGIRVVMDIVLNHVGYETTVDAAEFGFGPLGDPWQVPNTGLDPLGAGWCNWWTDDNGVSWIRKEGAGEYCSPAESGDDLGLALAGLPDIRTDLTTNVDLPRILLNKWDAAKETQEIAELNTFFSNNPTYPRNPANHIIKWLTDWVREYGVDGFRIDTYKHVEREVWGRLKDQAQIAFDDWKAANPSKVLDDKDFWMVGEWYGHGPGRNAEAATIGKTDALINFNFKGPAANPTNIEATYANYASIVTNNPDWTFLSYLSSHDDGMFDRNNLFNGATALMLAPGGAQIYYGDETQRPEGTSGSDQDTRSLMNWGSINTALLAHWQKLGQFRKKHPAIGAGTHSMLQSTPYAFKREYQGAGFQDLVLCVVGANGSTTLDVGNIFTDGTELRDYYTNTTATVSGGSVTFTAHSNGVILIEETNPLARPTVSMTPEHNSFDPTSITVSITATDLSDPNPTIYYTTDPNLPTNDLTGWTVYSNAFTLTATATVRALAVNSSSTQSSLITNTYYVGSIPGFKVYFKKPANWGATVNIHYFDQVPAGTPTVWPGQPMTNCGDWYEYEIPGIVSTSIVFNDGTLQTADLSRDREGYYDGTMGVWSDTPPAGFDCNCVDVDGDGVCDTTDCDDNDPNIPTTPGTSCDDGNPSTTNDQIQADGCTCVGCDTDADLDGVCATDDCDDNNPNVPAPAGTPCDDGDPNTVNDQIQADGCTCAGSGSFMVYFKKPANWSMPVKIHYWGQSPSGAPTNWPGVNMTQCSINPDWWYFSFTGVSSTNLIFHDGAGRQTADLSRSADGWFENGEWLFQPPLAFSCDSCTTDADGDGVCADVDCDDNDPSVPALPGTACDDGDPTTENDQIQADGCTCAGGMSFTVYFKKPAGWATPVKIHFWERMPGSTSTTWPGVDMTQCTVNPDWWFFTFTGSSSSNLIFNDDNGNQTGNLSRNSDGWYDGAWSGVPPSAFACQTCTLDADGDGVCADIDCDDSDPNLPAAPGTACNDGDPNTTNDQIQADGCTCQGTGTFTVYFKKPTDWAAANIHYWNREPGTTATTWPGDAMTACASGNGWYSYTFSGTSSTNLIFNAGSSGPQTANLSRSADGWYDGGWSAAPPAAFNCQSCTTDADGDGICADVDCDDNDPNLPAPPGTACNDGDPNTINDQIQADGCTCAGFAEFTVYFKKPTNWASPVKIHFWNRMPGATASAWPGVDMSLCGNGWWSYTFTAASETELLFHDAAGNQTDDLFRSSEGWYDGGWMSSGSCSTGGVTVSPAIPGVNEAVTITFDASGTDLAGLSNVYFHSGVSTTQDQATSFNYAVGNWGQDDGVGQMTHQGGNVWQITLPSLATYYGVNTATDDIFGLNFLFRSADGSLKEDNSGANYFNPVSTGNYFTITSPTNTPHLIPQNSSFNLSSLANTSPSSWVVEEVDELGNVIATIGTQTGGINYTEVITLTDVLPHRYKVTANFGSGAKYKFVRAQAYGAICSTPRPSWARLGINYHDDDPTKATLILHAPTYTRYKKGNGFVSGTGFTPPKDVVHLIGDFNGWSISESYKMCRDTDGWNGTTDADGDDDRGDYWWITISGLTPGQEYVFQYLIDGHLQVADPYAEKISDPDDQFIDENTFPDLISYPADKTKGHRASVLQTNQTEYVWTAPPFSRPTNNNLDIYELHFRDFTEEGTYLAAIDKLDYLKSLGINAIHVMPISEFEGNDSWGYNPNFYFAPDKAYGTKDDLKKFIDECHKREIQVFNDLVLNHVFYSNVMARMYWNHTDNKPATHNPWFNADHKAVAEPAGWWGADWNHESEHVQIMVDSAINFWLQEYKFDGYRFDFTKGITQTDQDPNDPWASSYDQDRIDILKRMADNMWADNPGSVIIFEHLANSDEDKVLADHGILMWSGAGHHAAMKNFMLGYNQDNPDIYTSGIYNTPGRNFNFANWMSYMESHDEERQAYEVLAYANTIANEPNATAKLNKAVDRLKLGAAFNLLFPGPRMLWQFEELAYDVSINFNGRTGRKPIRWEYLLNDKRRELYRLMSTAFYLRQNYPLYSVVPDYDNIGWGANVITTPRRMMLNDGAGNYVIIIGNLDPTAGHDAYPAYPVGGTWYRHNGSEAMDGTSFTVSNTGSPYFLGSNEVIILTNFPVNNPVLDDNLVNVSARVILGGAYQTTTSLMRDDLRALNYIPTTEPYTAMGYTFVGDGGGESVNPSVFTTTGPDAIVDWVLLELRDETSPATVISSRAALVQRDGDIVDLDGRSTCVPFTNTSKGNYYLTVKHRNHLSVSTAQAEFFSPIACTIDFSKPSTTSWGSNAQRSYGRKMGLWPGDGNGDAKVVYSGAGTDVNAVSFKVLNAESNPFNFPFATISGYNIEDVNLDGRVVYSGANTDVNIISVNIFNHVGNIFGFPFFVVQQQQP